MRAMANLRHRVLPPQLLLKWPKEASFCQLLMHPAPETRPKMRCVVCHVLLCLSKLWLEKACVRGSCFTLGNKKYFTSIVVVLLLKAVNCIYFLVTCALVVHFGPVFHP